MVVLPPIFTSNGERRAIIPSLYSSSRAGGKLKVVYCCLLDHLIPDFCGLLGTVRFNDDENGMEAWLSFHQYSRLMVRRSIPSLYLSSGVGCKVKLKRCCLLGKIRDLRGFLGTVWFNQDENGMEEWFPFNQ